MRTLLPLLLSILCLLPLSGQIDTNNVDEVERVEIHELLARPAWVDQEGSDGEALYLNAEGNFDEDAGEKFTRSYRHLLGRWYTGDNEKTLTLAVDGLMGKGLVHARYRNGRDFFIEYDIISVSNEELVLRDQKTRKLKTFSAASREDYQEPAVRRIPKSTKPGVFKLPDGWGGR